MQSAAQTYFLCPRPCAGSEGQITRLDGRSVRRRALLGCGTAAAALLGWAQVAAAADASTASTATADGPQTTSQVGEVIVTANKRAENVQDVSASVGVVSGQKLVQAGDTRIADYIAYLPGVTANTYGGTPGQSIITIRGIAPLSAGAMVATYIDDSPVGSSGIWAQSFVLTPDLGPFDLERVEVLAGPQGTLYGATSMGGVLKYVLTTPNTHAFSGAIAADAAYVDHAGSAEGTIDGMVNIPIKEDVLAISASGHLTDTPGYINDAYTGAKGTNSDQQYGGRVSLLWNATPNLTVKLNGLYQSINSADDGLISFANPTEAAATTTNDRLVSGGTPYGSLTENKAFLEPFKGTLSFYSGTIDWNPGPVEVVSATSWSRDSANRLIDSSGTYGSELSKFGQPAGLATTDTYLVNEKFTQELRIQSPDTDRIAWRLGGFFTDESQTDQQTFSAFTTAYVPITAFGPHLGYVTIPTHYLEAAIFGDVTFNVTDKLEIGGGLRESGNWQNFSLSSEGPLLGTANKGPIKSNADDLTWMATAQYHFTPDVMAYTRIATGYAPGGANTPGTDIPPTVGSETLTSYEVGIKSEFLDRRALFDLSVYHEDEQDIQLTAFTPVLTTYTTNGGDAAINGMELTTSYTPVQNLVFGLTAAYSDAELTSLNPNIATAFILHDQIERVPKGTVAGTVSYSWDLSGDWTAQVSGGAHWTDSEAAVEATYNKPFYELPAFTVVDLDASITKDRLTFRVYAKNIGNAQGLGYVLPQTNGLTGKITQVDYSVIQPATVGIGVIATF